MPHDAALLTDPRIERSRRLVLDATIELLGEQGYGALTIEAVAARSGVAKSTIYRHWPGKVELVEAAFAALKPPIAVCEGGCVRDRIVDFVEQMAAQFADSSWSSCLPAFIEAAERDPVARRLQRKISAERRKVLVELIREGVGSGELPACIDPDLAADCIAGAVVLRRLERRDQIKPADARRLVGQVLPEK
ncbi:MAG: TetR/AcrR family transcriptional regulator [Acidimicrobiales bacterium]